MHFHIIVFVKLLQLRLSVTSGLMEKNNPADIVSKHWSYPQVWHLIQPILFFSGDTSVLMKEINQEQKEVEKKI